MPPPLGNRRLAHFGSDVEKLFNGRFRLIRRFQPTDNSRVAAKEELEANYFEEFGEQDLTPFGLDPADIPEGFQFEDCVLVRQYTTYPPGLGFQIFVKEYETVTDEWEETEPLSKSTTNNGLTIFNESLIAKPGTPYGGIVGTDEIVIAGVTYVLASVEEVETSPAFTRLRVRWAEPGTLSVSKRHLSEGVTQVSTTFLGREGTIVGPVTAREVSDFDGMQTIVVTTLQDKNGNALGDVESATVPVNSFNQDVEFQYPGIVRLIHDEAQGDFDGAVKVNIFRVEADPPVQAEVENAQVYVFFQKSSLATSADRTFDGAEGYWNPKQWAKLEASGIGHRYAPFVVSEGLRGYRLDPDVSGIQTVDKPGGTASWKENGAVFFQTKEPEYIGAVNNTTAGSLLARVEGVSDGQGIKFIVNGQRLFGATPFILQLSGGPVNPVGRKLVMKVDIRPAFEDVDGVQFYKKTIIVGTP